MNSLILAAMVDELTKLAEQEKAAFNVADANKVLSLAKGLQLPKASKVVQPMLSAAPNFKKVLKDAQVAGRLGGVSPQDVAEVVAQFPGADIVRRSKKVIFPGRTGNVPALLRGRWTEARAAERAIGPELSGKLMSQLGPEPKRLPAENMKMLHAVVKGHELDEAVVRGRIGASHLGHRSPEVIFREHNRVMTLPQEHEAIRDFMKAVRQRQEGAWLFPKGMAYGESPRLSRHARRRLTESAERRTLEAQDLVNQAAALEG